jgi:plasmid stabilization system protein ParE
MTQTALEHFKAAVRETKKKWGLAQAKKYNADFQVGLRYLAQHHATIRTHYRDAMTKGAAFSVHLVEHRYVAYQTHNDYNVIIAGIFHEKMDIPTHLEELAQMSIHEIAMLRRQLSRS